MSGKIMSEYALLNTTEDREYFISSGEGAVVGVGDVGTRELVERKVTLSDIRTEIQPQLDWEDADTNPKAILHRPHAFDENNTDLGIIKGIKANSTTIKFEESSGWLVISKSGS